MRKIYKALAVLAALPILCGASANAKEIQLTDINKQTPYYESVQRIYDKGVITGYEDNTFRPNNKISVAEGITLAEKVLGDTYTLPKEWSEWFSDKCGWNNHISLDGYPFRGDYSSVMTYETAAELLMKLKDIPLINTAMWETPALYGGFSEYTNNLYIRGYTDAYGKKPISFYGITRAEFCNMLTFILDYDGKYTIPKQYEPIIEPEIYENINADNSREIILNAQSALICVPEYIRQRFADDGYSVVLIPGEKWEKLFDKKYVGIYHNSDKSIYLRIGYYSSLPHEFGHYLHYTLENKQDYNISTDTEFKQQLGEFKSVNNRYFMTNDAEFFAEAFSVYCNQADRLKNSNKSLYDFVDNAVKAFSE